MNATQDTSIFVGRIVKAFGIRGELKLSPSDDFWDGVLASKCLTMRTPAEEGVEERPFVVERVRPHGKGAYVVKLDGIDTRNDAETLVGGEVFVAEGDLDVDLPDRLLPFQVIGATVRDEAGEVLGEVKGIIKSPAHDIYEVGRDGRSFLVPAVPEFIVGVDVERRELTIRPLPGLIED